MPDTKIPLDLGLGRWEFWSTGSAPLHIKNLSLYLRVSQSHTLKTAFNLFSLDVGYNGIPKKTGFINNVLNTYFTQYFPRAVNLSEELRRGGYVESFVYTTHPWLVSLYMDCPQLVLNQIPLKVSAQFKSAVRNHKWQSILKVSAWSFF